MNKLLKILNKLNVIKLPVIYSFYIGYCYFLIYEINDDKIPNWVYNLTIVDGFYWFSNYEQMYEFLEDIDWEYKFIFIIIG